MARLNGTSTGRSALALALAVTATVSGGAGNVDLPRYPSINPDGEEIVFTWRGDLWRAPTAGGEAVRLTVHGGDDVRSLWSPDGGRIAFSSTRGGSANIYVMNADGSDVRPVTKMDRACIPTGFAADPTGGEVIVCHSDFEGDVYREYRPYSVSARGGELRRLHDAFGSQPRVSPDGARIAFVRGGYYDRGESRRHYRGAESSDVWIFEWRDGSFDRLTTWDGNDRRPKWAGDDAILFLSDRELDCVNLYRMSADGDAGDAVRLTSFRDEDLQDFDITADGSRAVLSVWDTLYTLDLTKRQARPVPIALSATEDDEDDFVLKQIDRNVTEATLSPDGKVMAAIAYGDVYVRAMEESSPTRRVTRTPAREKDLAWSPDGLKLYFVSDGDGSEAIFAATVATTRTDLREAFTEATGRPLEQFDDADDDKAKSDDGADGGKPGADDGVSGVWSGVVEVPEMGPLPFTITLSLDGPGSVSGTLEAAAFSGPLSGSHDPATGRLSFTVDAEDGVPISFDVTIKDGAMTGTATREGESVDVDATRRRAAETGPEADEGDENAKDEAEKDDAEDDDLPKELRPDRWHDAVSFDVDLILGRDGNVREPNPSPDGDTLAFRGTRGEIGLLDLETGETRTLLDGWDASTEIRWSPDGEHIAYARGDLDFNRDIFIMPVDGSSEPINITRHPNDDGSPRFSADGRILAFISERVNDEADVWMVYLDEDLEALNRRDLEKYYESRIKAAGKRKPVAVRRPGAESEDAADDEESPRHDLELEDAYLRVKRMTTLEGSEENLELTPAGDRLIFTASGDVSGLHSVKWDGSDRTRLGSGADVQEVSLTGDAVVLVDGGQAATVKPGGGAVERVDISDRIRVDLEAQSSQKFLEAARRLGEEYYHPTMNGLDWTALSAKYHALARTARTAEEFNWVANRFIGELNGSHLRISAPAPPSPNQVNLGRLGTTHRRVADGFEIIDVVPRSPAEKGPMALEPGDVITAVELEPLRDEEPLERALADRVGKETVLTVRRGESVFSVFMTPIGARAERQLKYEAWRRENARLVSEWTDGRIGYIHIQGMSQPSLDVFERDLFAAAGGKDGLIIDVRNNGGGWTTDRVLASIMVQPHAYTIPRGADPSKTGHYPQPRLFIQRYTQPMNLLCNEKSYSNAEIMSHAFKNLNRGTLVGQQTHGSVISTGGWSLIDGTWVRLPFRGWFVMDGTDMELNGAMPDLLVPQTPESEVAGEDVQLRAAVEDLMGRLD